MKRLCILLLCAGLTLAAWGNAQAIDFKAKGQWRVGFAATDLHLVQDTRNGDVKSKKNLQNQFDAVQWVRLQLDAVASESLSGNIYFEIGNQRWGQASTGGALGADGKMVKVKRAYIDWMMPETPLKVRMGIQGVNMPYAAGGSAIMDTDAAGITASYQINDNVGLTALWFRPLNDNFTGNDNDPPGYLDNLDLFTLSLPITLDGYTFTPWITYGIKGRNAMKNINEWEGFQDGFATPDGNLPYSLYPYPGMSGWTDVEKTSKAYGSMFWAGLPITITAFDPWNIEFDINYGYVEEMGRFWTYKNGVPKHASTERQGWLAKALVEYKLNWGVPGIFGWYASGDDGNPKNGSERMPSIVPCQLFTSFMGDGNLGWIWNDYGLDLSGTWGIGAQLRDISFIEDLDHTIRVAYYGGTNSTNMVKYMSTSYSWVDGWGSNTSPYLTTNDGLLEFNLVNVYKMYENFDINLEFSYVANFIDNDTWKKAGNRDTSFSKQDAYKVQLVFNYTF